MKTLTWWMAAVFALGATAFGGTGTEADPYTIAEALALSEGTTEYWAQGYIVGGRYDDFELPCANDYGISCADTDSETNVDNCLQVKLANDGSREVWGLASAPGNLGKLIKFKGQRGAYGSYSAFVNIAYADISEVALENQPPVMGAIGNKMVIEGNTLTFAVTATDTLDGDEIALSATGLPAGAVFAGATNAGTASSTFTWANAGPLGDYSVTFTATDKDGTVQKVVQITVHDGSGPLEIAFQGFEGTASDTWGTTDIDATLVRNSTGTADTPANQRVRTGSYSWQPGEGEYTTEALELAAVDVSEWSDVVMTLHVSATTTEPGDGYGMFPTETLSVSLALDGANFPAVADIVVTGNELAGGSITGALWSYTATGVAATTAGVSRTVAPASGGVTADGIATVQIALPPGTTSAKLKVEVAQEFAGYFWNVDDISLAGINDGGASDFPPTISISPEGLEKSVAVGNNLSFTIHASEIPNDACRDGARGRRDVLLSRQGLQRHIQQSVLGCDECGDRERRHAGTGADPRTADGRGRRIDVDANPVQNWHDLPVAIHHKSVRAGLDSGGFRGWHGRRGDSGGYECRVPDALLSRRAALKGIRPFNAGPSQVRRFFDAEFGRRPVRPRAGRSCP